MNFKTLILSGLLLVTSVTFGQVKQIKDANTSFRSGNYCEGASKC